MKHKRRSFTLDEKLDVVKKVEEEGLAPTDITDAEGRPIHPFLVERWVSDFKAGTLRGSNDLRKGPNSRELRQEDTQELQARIDDPWGSQQVSDSVKVKIAELLLEVEELRDENLTLKKKLGRYLSRKITRGV